MVPLSHRRWCICRCPTPFCLWWNTAANRVVYRTSSAIAARVYTRANPWARKGVLDRVFCASQANDTINIRVDHVSLDSTAVKAHPDGAGGLKKRSTIYRQSRAGWTTKTHLVAADATTAVAFSLSPVNAGDAPEGIKLLETFEDAGWGGVNVIMDKV